ncbi:hypothetical protein NEOLEDRAFT_1079391, partial [Neolentinus lepideus HHB14362 ss-1]
VIGILIGRPRSENWNKVQAGASRAMARAAEEYKCPPGTDSHRRGDYPLGIVGVSYGGGHKASASFSLLAVSFHNGPVLNTLLENSNIKRIAGFTNRAFSLTAPRLHAYYRSTMDRLCQRYKTLCVPFDKRVWACTCFNFGPQVHTNIHTDHLNKASGWCAITALGNFDSERGGHLVLWDLGLVIEFPAGTTIMIPSALLRHSNLPVRDGETRYSVVQWSAGGLFHWIDFGFHSVKSFEASCGKRATGSIHRAHWKVGMSLLPKLRDFRVPAA